MAEVTEAGAMHAARETFGKTINVVVDILLPVGSAVAGFFMPSAIGGGYSVGQALPALGGGNSYRVAWGVQALINAAIGTAFWHMRHGGGLVLKAIGGAIGGFFIGAALGCVIPLVQGTTGPSSGLVDSIAAWAKGAASGD